VDDLVGGGLSAGFACLAEYLDKALAAFDQAKATKLPLECADHSGFSLTGLCGFGVCVCRVQAKRKRDYDPNTGVKAILENMGLSHDALRVLSSSPSAHVWTQQTD
jgi:hypothetical protein